MFDRGDRARDLAGYERFAADRTLVIEQNAVRRVHAIGFAVIDRDPIGIELCGRGYEWPRASAAFQVHRRWPYIPASRTRLAHATVPRGCRSHPAAFPAQCG